MLNSIVQRSEKPNRLSLQFFEAFLDGCWRYQLNLGKCHTKHACQKFSLKVGTVFEDSPIGLDKWFCAMWLIVNCKNGVSSYEIHRAPGVTQKTAWFMLHRIRLAMQSGSFEKMSGGVEAHETSIGGRAHFMHRAARARKIRAGGPVKRLLWGCWIARLARFMSSMFPTSSARRYAARFVSMKNLGREYSLTNGLVISP
jgi:hypothetical protein